MLICFAPLKETVIFEVCAFAATLALCNRFQCDMNASAKLFSVYQSHVLNLSELILFIFPQENKQDAFLTEK